MHIADGVVSMPVLVTGTLFAGVGVAAGLRAITPERLPAAALVSAMFFVASLIHVPIGPAKLHLVLNGLAGLILGSAVFPAILIALLLQAFMFGYGGLSVLGLNTLIMALPGYFGYVLFIHQLRKTERRSKALLIGFSAGACGIFVASLLLFSALVLSGERYNVLASALFVSHLPLLLIEALVTGVAARFLWQIKPEILMESRPHETV
ncbi:MAG TPA: cobalt transporter CbiM [Kiritimatiellia bacterium]|nr:cobalt transporter CbiM [Kiritimatiellia bacterium]